MPVITTCPDCDKKLKVPDDLLGKKVKCPGCSKMFTAEDGDAPPPPPANGKKRDSVASTRPSAPPARGRDLDDDDDRPRRRTRRDDDDDDRDRDRDRDDDRPRGRSRRDDDDDDDRDRDRDRGRGRDRFSDRRRDDDDYDDDRRGRGRGRGRDRDDDYDDRRESPREIRNGWKGVRTGINLAIIGCWLLAGGIVLIALVGELGLFLVGGMFNTGMAGRLDAGSATGFFGTMGVLMIVGIIAMLVEFAGEVLFLIGLGMCMQTPTVRGESYKGLVIAAFACAALMVLARWSLTFVSLGGGMFVSGGPTGLLLLGLVVCWSLALNGMCRQVRAESKVIMWMITFLVTGAVLVILTVIILFSFGMAMISGGPMNPGGVQTTGNTFLILMGVLIALWGLAYAGLFVWHGLILTEARGSVERHLAKL